MSKRVSAKELAEIVGKLLSPSDEELPGFDQYQEFMTSIAEVVCDYCGGEVKHVAEPLEDTWYIRIHGNDSLPEDGGIWKDYDPDGELKPEED